MLTESMAQDYSESKLHASYDHEVHIREYGSKCQTSIARR
jgi:hypothetical protein